MRLSAIFAMASNRVIGKNGDLPWHIPEDFKFFKDKTSGHIMIMGRKTYESLPGLLANRLHIVITRQAGFDPTAVKGYKPEQVLVAASIDEALAEAKKHTARYGDEVFMIGGAELFKQTLPRLNRIYLTEIHQDFDGDTFLPEFDRSAFKEIERQPRQGPPPFDFVTYERL